MMKKISNSENLLEKKEKQEKKKYISPTLEVTIVEMECGIAAASASVAPASVLGNTDVVNTDWAGSSDTTTIETPF